MCWEECLALRFLRCGMVLEQKTGVGVKKVRSKGVVCKSLVNWASADLCRRSMCKHTLPPPPPSRSTGKICAHLISLSTGQTSALSRLVFPSVPKTMGSWLRVVETIETIGVRHLRFRRCGPKTNASLASCVVQIGNTPALAAKDEFCQSRWRVHQHTGPVLRPVHIPARCAR